MEVITKVACGSVIAGGGGAAGAYGVHRISVAYEKDEESTTPRETEPETPQSEVESLPPAEEGRQAEVAGEDTPKGDAGTTEKGNLGTQDSPTDGDSSGQESNVEHQIGKAGAQ